MNATAVAALDIDGTDATITPARFTAQAGQVVLIITPEGTTARAAIEMPQSLALADAPAEPLTAQ